MGPSSKIAVCAAVVGAIALTPISAGAQQASSASVASTTPEYSAAMQRLLEAAQHLRDASHEMAEGKTIEARNKAIKQTNEALLATQRAVLEIPSDLRRPSNSSGYDAKGLDRLKKAAQKMREAAQALADQPAGEGRNAAIKQINSALLETQQAMFDVLQGGTNPATTGKGSKQERN